jgi:hypothetical protein
VPSVDHALIHRARVRRDVRGDVRDEQGERQVTTVYGPWFPARRMTKRQSPERRDDGGVARGVIGYSLMWGEEDELGALLVPPVASDLVEVDDLRGDVHLWEVQGPPLDFDTGAIEFGGQADIVRVVDGA